MSTVPRSRFRIRYRTAILLLAFSVIVWSGFSYWTEYSENSARRARELLAPPLGLHCRIVLDSEDQSPLRGTIIEQSDRWIVLQPLPHPDASITSGNPLWIPRERVLLIEFEH